MSVAVDTPHRSPQSAILRSPLMLLALAATVCAVLLSLPLRAPVGPMYWDVFIYFDAANRIFDGQVPVIDFFTPVGPLGYYLFAVAAGLFPNGQPTLLAHWSTLILTAPLMAVVAADIDRRSRITAFALVIPFLFFALLPFNTREYYPFPGSDGFGIYNRQVCQVLYVLVSAAMFLKSGRRLAFIVASCVTALFFLKITGFASALIVCVFAFVSGRLALRHSVAAALAFFLVLGGLEASLGLVSHYVGDILALVAMNSGSLLPRFLQSASHTFGVIAPAGALVLLLLWSDRHAIARKLGALRAAPSFAAAAGLIDHRALWLGVVLFAGVFFETQNTGSQAMIFVWPVLLAILLRTGSMLSAPKTLIASFALAAAAFLPIVVNTAERAARAYVGAVKGMPLANDNLGVLGNILMRPEIAERAAKMYDFYPRHRETFADFVAIGELPSFVQYSEFDFQVVHLMAIDRAVENLRAVEADKGIRFETLMTLNFVNVFPYLMDRSAPRHIAIGADPTRAVPEPDAQVAAAVRDVDIALYPTCPLTTANRMLDELYAPMLKDHLRITLDACYDAYVHPRFAASFGRDR